MIAVIRNKTVCHKAAALLVILMLTLGCAGCGEDKSDDSTMTQSLLNSYMNSLCDYNITDMNKCCMAKLDSYNDSEEAVKACRSLAGRIEWQSENISIDGNSAIAQVRLTLPADFSEICDLALSDTIKSLDAGSESDPARLLTSAIKKRAGKAETVGFSVEVSMTKVDNKWYIVKSLGVNRVLSDIRTPVASVYSMIGG